MQIMRRAVPILARESLEVACQRGERFRRIGDVSDILRQLAAGVDAFDGRSSLQEDGSRSCAGGRRTNRSPASLPATVRARTTLWSSQGGRRLRNSLQGRTSRPVVTVCRGRSRARSTPPEVRCIMVDATRGHGGQVLGSIISRAAWCVLGTHTRTDCGRAGRPMGPRSSATSA